jgi:large subunit ribosomal protein L21
MYAIVKTGGKQYRVEQGQSLLVEKLAGSDGESLSLQPLLFVDGSTVVDAASELEKVTVSARVVGQERGPKLRVVKFKPKRGYKRRTGHRQDLTRIEVTEIAFGGGGSKSRSRSAKAASPKPVAAATETSAAEKPEAAPKSASEATPKSAPEAAPKSAPEAAPKAAPEATLTPSPEATNGA